MIPHRLACGRKREMERIGNDTLHFSCSWLSQRERQETAHSTGAADFNLFPNGEVTAALCLRENPSAPAQTRGRRRCCASGCAVLLHPRRDPDRAFSVFPSRENPFPRRGRSVPKADPAKFCQPFFYISVPAPTFPLSLYAVHSGRDRQKKSRTADTTALFRVFKKFFRQYLF